MNEYLKKYVEEQINWNTEKVISDLKVKYDTDKYYYDSSEALNFKTFIEKLELDKGAKNKKIKLNKFQFELCTSIICVKRRSDGLRRFREAHINIPRKNGKSFIIACIFTYLYYCRNEFGSETIISANSSQQAGLLFNTIIHMINKNKTLKKYVKITDSRKYMYKKNMNAYLRVISSDASNADSYAGLFCVLDEIHEAKNRNLYDKLKTGMGIWKEPLMLTITTASSGQDPNNLEYELYSFCKDIEKGEVEDDSMFYAIYEADINCNLLDEKQWFKANPALGTFRSYEELKALALRATKIKTQETAFRRLYLNQHVALDGTNAIDLNLWDLCVYKIDLEELRGMTYWGGLDMSLCKDITAFVRVFYDDNRDKYIIYPSLYTPADTIFERTERENVRYDTFVAKGELIALEGKSISVTQIVEDIEAVDNEYDFINAEIAYDRWGAKDIRAKLEEKYDIAEMGQGYATMSPAIRDFENLLLDSRLIIAENSCLRWMAQNVVAVMDDAANIKYSKRKSKNKIDGIIALIMALARAVFNTVEEREVKATGESIKNFYSKLRECEE